MKTLIELYDERPIENVLGTEMFRPEETIFICPPEVAEEALFRPGWEQGGAALAAWCEQEAAWRAQGASASAEASADVRAARRAHLHVVPDADDADANDAREPGQPGE